ncbi:receptor-like protein EIX2 [Dioscorea cayenensis subsp. rotundata]|uniref:Receptor-like protein EIX2 n=1 Tax=Dioscorea cayennensis subsp. rotundata TaxID=55577 RepID=A0AB40CDW4_DIOCR|nr:receptor-like protein EIX2 [Dioscorea cayenensis subsp. rotundata]
MGVKLTGALLVVLLYLKFSICDGVSIKGCKENERKALLDLKEGLKDPGRRLSSWVGQDCCIWRGVQCDNQTGHVVQLDLGNKRPLHDMFQYGPRSEPLEGEISPALLWLKHLKYLDLSMNFFGGIQIPAFIGSLAQLRYLDLSCAGFSGLVPHELGNLSHLHHLDLSNPFYSSWNKLYIVGSYWLSNLSSLQYLNLNFVGLSKATDWLESLNTLPSVSEIYLSNCTLELPLSLAQVNLTKLKVLDLSSNNVHSVVPPWLFKLSSLENLDLSVNAFKELVPSAIGNLTSLRVLNLANNRVLEVGVPLSLENLCMLTSLDLSGNKYLHGDLNELGEVFSGCIKDSLEILNWVFSELTGQFPDWLGNLKSLKMLNLYGNYFYGPFLQLGLHSLKKLDVSRNTLNGSVPVNLAHLAGLAKLQHLGFSANEFRVDLGSQWVPPLGLKMLLMWNSKLGPGFPSWIQKLENLSALLLSNAGISDTLPDWFWNFSANLQLVDLSLNVIRGKLPATLEHLSNLRYVDLSGNSFEGSLPQFPANLEYLLLFSNTITGRIPETLCYLKKLAALDLSKNQLIGEIPDCWNHSLRPRLFTFDLSDNKLSGGIPTTICSSSLDYLHLSNNNLSGKLPLSLRNCRALRTLDLGQNKISGSIPTWLPKSLLNLEALRLRSNMFVGLIPPGLGNLTALRVIDFAYNHLSGLIPHSFGNLKAMRVAHTIFYNKKVAFVAYDKISLDYVDNMEILYMTSNKLGLGYMDNMRVNLKGKDVRYGKLLPLVISIDLSRGIPQEINMLRWLESLDLSMNNLSGPIPATMTMLSLLSHLNLSYNNLSGEIPYGGQLFSLLDPSIYAGNSALCGLPISKECKNDRVAPHQKTSYDGGIVSQDDNNWLLLSMEVGYCFGLFTFGGLLLLKSEWSFSFFQFIDNFHV